MSNQAVAARPIDQLKSIMASASVKEQFANALAENSNLFVASLIDLYASDTYLQQCNPAQVVAEALKAATLKLPINKALGYAYVVPYKKQGQQVQQFQLGYKGMVQLAMRTGQYRYLTDGEVYKGEFKGFNKLTGELDLSGEKVSDEVIGYFAHIETVHGFKKTLYCTKEDMLKHAKRYSKSFDRNGSPWQSEFDAMAQKTMLRKLLSKYGIMSVDMADGMGMDDEDREQFDYQENANKTLIDIIPGPPPPGVDAETGEVTDPNGTRQQEMSSAEIDAQLALEEAPY